MNMEQTSSAMGGGDMPGGEMNPPGVPPATLSGVIEANVERLVNQVVDRALAEVDNRQERGAIRQYLAQDLRQVLTELAHQELARQMGLAAGNGAGGMAVGEAIQAGMAAAAQVQNLGFVDFTKGLIDGTFQAVIGATMSQMEAYARLVADLAKTLAQFQAENVGQGEITAHLANRYPDGQGGTSVRSGFTFQDTPANPETGAPAKSANQKFQEVVDALVAETRALTPPFQLTREAGSLNIPTTDQSIKKFEDAHLNLIRPAIGRMLATNMMENLRAMAREGMARIVITNGEILSKLTFNVSATSEQARQASQYHSDSLGISARASASWGWGSASLSGSYNQLNVRTVNERNFDNVTMSAEIIGQVKIGFKTETFPPVTTAAALPAGG
jgi:hypothetical protein